MTLGGADSATKILGAEGGPFRTLRSRRPLPQPRLPRGPRRCGRGRRGGHGRAAAAVSRPHPARLATFPTPGRPRDRGAEPRVPGEGPPARPLLPARASPPIPGPGGPGPDPDRRSSDPLLPGRPAPPRRGAEEGGAGPSGQSLPRAPAAQLKAAERKVPWAGGRGCGRPGRALLPPSAWPELGAPAGEGAWARAPASFPP